MGDRGNINVDGVYLYTHWRGSYLPKILQEALAKRWRWTDGGYLCRIIFEQMLGRERDTETGFGIALGLLDNSHLILFVDSNKGTVTLREEPSERTNVPQLGRELGSWSFEAFLKIELEDGDLFEKLLEARAATTE